MATVETYWVSGSQIRGTYHEITLKKELKGKETKRKLMNIIVKNNTMALHYVCYWRTNTGGRIYI